MVVFGQKWLYTGRSGSIKEKLVVVGKSFCIRGKCNGSNGVKVVVIGKKWFNSGKSGSTRAKVVVFGQSGCIRVKWF